MKELRSIYIEEFDRSQYFPRKDIELKKKIPPLSKVDILNNLQSAFQHGYLGYHILEDWWPIDFLKGKMHEVMGELSDGLGFRYCRSHNKMIVCIDPFKIAVLPSQYSSIENGEKFADFCFDTNLII